MKSSLFRGIMLGILTIALAWAVGNRAYAMKALSSADMSGVTGQQGVSVYFENLDANLLRLDSIELNLSPDDANNFTFRIVDESDRAGLFFLPSDTDDYAFSFCGSGAEESVPIAVDFLGFDIDVARRLTGEANGIRANAVTLSLVGYGSTALYNVWDLAQFVSPEGTAYDVFGLTLGEIFWAEKYMDPDKTRLMHTLLSPLSFYQDGAFVDSNTGGWHNIAQANIRSNTGIAGELGLKPGGGTFGFLGLQKFNPDGTPSGEAQKATANSVFLAGKILDKGPTTAATPNWKTFNRNYYYQDSYENWNIMGEAVLGVHHERAYDREDYNGGYIGTTAIFDMDAIAQSQIGQTSATRPIRFDVATASGRTYLVAYLCGHYSRSVYYPDSAVSSMGTSPYNCAVPTVTRVGGVDRPGAFRNYIIGDLRIGRLEEKTDDMDGRNGRDTNLAGTAIGVTHGGSWALNDISVPYQKTVIALTTPGNTTSDGLRYEVSSASEGYLIPNRDYGTNGSDNNSTSLTFNGDPTSRARTMQIATPFDGGAGNPLSNQGTDINFPRAGAYWK